MTTMKDMVEHCEACGTELELGQIGDCDDCQDIKKETNRSSAGDQEVLPESEYGQLVARELQRA